MTKICCKMADYGYYQNDAPETSTTNFGTPIGLCAKEEKKLF
jgi:hypothetical protein